MSSAQSAAVSRSNLAPAPLGSSFLISTWFSTRALLLALPGVAVEEPGLAVPLAEQRRDGALVGELAPVVGEYGAEGAPRAVLAEDPAQGGERRQDRGARAVRQRQGQLEAARAVQEREEPGGVAPGALDGVHLPGRGAGVLAEREERRVDWLH